MTDKPSLIERLSDEADLCRNEGADDIAALLDEARRRIEELEDVAFEQGEYRKDRG